MTIRILFRLLLACSMYFVNCRGGGKNSQHTNFILIQVDDLGYDDLSIHGNQFLETPRLDSFAKQSLRFDQFYLQSVCAPSRAALLTGRHYRRTGVSGVHAGRDYINLDETIIAELFKENGYATGMWGKWHSGKTNGYFPWDRGFDEAYYSCLYNYFENEGLLNGEHVEHKGYETDIVTDMAIKFIKRNLDEPFFAYISHLAPHNPWRAPKGYVNKYLAKGLSEPMSTLYGMIDNLDHNIGRIFDLLKRLDLEDNTIIIFISDNGPWIKSYRFGLTDNEWQLRNPHGYRGTKATNWDNGVKSPLFIRWPGHIKAGKVQDIVKIEDLFPTMLSIADIPLPDHLTLDGRDISPLFRGKKLIDEAVIFAHYTPAGDSTYYSELDKQGEAVPFTHEYKSTFSFENQRLAMRKGDYKYLQNQDEIADQLYDINSDSAEQYNISLENDSLVTSIKGELKEWFHKILLSPSSFTMPVFQIGYKQRSFNQIYACAPAAISKGLINKEHYLANWQRVADAANYEINVIMPGEYKVYLIHKIEDYGNFTFKVSAAGSETKALLTDSGDRNFGTLIENESAYWENFDLKETFKKDIIKSDMGSLKLTKGAAMLKIEIAEISKDHVGKLMDQIIAIHLIKK